ncbi:VOC family protein [Streptomyces brasiliensis]|uniref:VOC domain-containing protein n=1 Tax=Streptomyces brasiliensis TaxID=1954 RepID=A0A917L3C0_9ACTN|nr:VOC family protein [Streptomyces brasiliensis]GGJ42762.1 hypothetical protein GCM10010121_062500 [Streptomyces brasiliensis]
MPILELGHVGLWVNDLEKMRVFYRDVLELPITDEDTELGIVFFSARPQEEHHEFVIARSPEKQGAPNRVQQVSFRVDTVAELLRFHKKFKEAGVELQREVTHGNAYGIYFWDPEGNRAEVYYRVPIDVRQPFSKELNYDLPEEEFLAEAQRLLDEAGPAYQGVLGGGPRK